MTGCGCRNSRFANQAVGNTVAAITNNPAVGNVVGGLAGVAACKTTWQILPSASALISVISVITYKLNKYIHSSKKSSETLKICDKSLSLSDDNLSSNITISHNQINNIKFTYIKNCYQEKCSSIAIPENIFLKPSNIELISCKAFASPTNIADHKLNSIEASDRTKGTPEGDLIKVAENGSSIFAIAGLNYMIAGPGADKFYFSLCSTDIIDGQVGVIEGFDINLDKISFFCTKTEVHKEMISIFHDQQAHDQEYTYIQVCGREKCSAIALIGNIPLNVDDLILNERWEVVAAG